MVSPHDNRYKGRAGETGADRINLHDKCTIETGADRISPHVNK